ncbi:MAG TPA: RNA polymerase sigma-70 factor [Puia sp.]|nr:RNA polymerase sigma-70 factor [Puia sp.]
MPTEPRHNEKELFKEFLSGGEEAFTDIYEGYAPSLINYAAARLTSLEEARDIIHDLFVHLWEERDNISITHSLRGFLFAAVRYRIIDHIRRNITRREYVDRLQALSVEMELSNEMELEAKDLNRTIEKAISELPPRVREIYRLSRQQHRTVAEIADELQLSPQTVKNQLTTALSLLRSFLQKLPLIWWL